MVLLINVIFLLILIKKKFFVNLVLNKVFFGIDGI